MREALCGKHDARDVPAGSGKKADLAYHSRRQAVKLSVLIPVYNEVRTIDEILRLVTGEPTEKEVVVVDDGSTDGTRERLQAWDGNKGVRVIFQPRNLGKGRAVRTALEAARGEILVIQDADLEYDPAEYRLLLRPIESGRADVVFGSRFVGSSEHRVQNFWHQQGNRLLTLISNVVTGLNLSDMATCYKAFHRRVVPALAPSATDRVVMTVTIPAGTLPGAWFFIAQADGNSEVPETSETNQTLSAATTS